MRRYSGIGARTTPSDVLDSMENIARNLDSQNYVLFSGGAAGADSAFESGSNNKMIFLPWNGFNNKRVDNIQYFTISPELAKTAKSIAAQFNPNWNNLKYSVQNLHARNVAQILGPTLDNPVDFVICWTKDGKASGGTGQALRIAQHYNVKIFNLYNVEDKEMLSYMLTQN